MNEIDESELKRIEETASKAREFYVSRASPDVFELFTSDIPFLVEQVRRLQAENDETSRALLNTRKLASTTAATMKADIDKLSDWRERVIKYHGYLTGVITEAEAGE